MSEATVIVENLGKQYLLRHQQHQDTVRNYQLFSEYVVAKIKSTFRTKDKNKPRTGTLEKFWALRNISFSANRGEVLGIIGRNGAGKSTLLKILSRVTEPSEGRVRLRGRVASLLEVGTGFHPELTGWENIYLNGTILGMTRAEIKKKFDEIVAFAETERFLDTPVKRYSSGMYVRLAFAVAAHLEPEILVVDEVLAVGDAVFQKKCLGKVSQITDMGRTVLFVSHQMASVQNLCSSCLLLENGRLVNHGKSESVIKTYLQSSITDDTVRLDERQDRQGTDKLRFVSVDFRDDYGNYSNRIVCGATTTIILTINNTTANDLRNVHISIGVNDEFRQRILLLDTGVAQGDFNLVPKDINRISVVIPRMPLLPGRYSLTLYSTVNGVIADWIMNAVVFYVEAGDFFGTGRLPEQTQGVFVTDHSFSLGA